MANIAQIVNVIAPIFTRPDGLVLQTIFYPFELYSRTCGNKSLDVWWEGDTFSGGEHSGVRMLDVTSTLDERKKQLVIYVVNRSRKHVMETEVSLIHGSFDDTATTCTVNGPDIKTENTFKLPGAVFTKENQVAVRGRIMKHVFEPHSVTALVCGIS
jgi:alpha-N-arabinofuranosidase